MLLDNVHELSNLAAAQWPDQNTTEHPAWPGEAIKSKEKSTEQQVLLEAIEQQVLLEAVRR